MMDEYRAARVGAGVIERRDRAFVRMHGRDPLKMIQGLVTNDVAGAPPDRAVFAVLLTPKGKLLADVRIFFAQRRSDAENAVQKKPWSGLLSGGDVLIETAAAALENVTGTLKKFVPPLFARYEVVQDLSELGVYGPAAARVLGEAAEAEIPQGLAEDAIIHVPSKNGEELLLVRTLYTGDEGYDAIGSTAAIGALRERVLVAGAQPISDETLEVLRIEAGQPRWGAELTEDVIPLEAKLESRAISMSKGCYTGQEVIVRILHRGHVNWLLRGVMLGDEPPPAPGAPLLHPADARKIGRITSACVSPRHAQTIALAYTRRELEPPVNVKLDRPAGPDALIAELPFPSADVGEPAPVDVGA
jgi:folate-binding protein YgfZ